MKGLPSSTHSFTTARPQILIIICAGQKHNDTESLTFVLLPRGRPLGRFFRCASSACSPLAAPVCPYAACCAAVCTWHSAVTGTAEPQLTKDSFAMLRDMRALLDTGLLQLCQATKSIYQAICTMQQLRKAFDRHRSIYVPSWHALQPLLPSPAACPGTPD